MEVSCNTVRATRETEPSVLRATGRERLRSFAAHGTTTVEGKTGYGLDLTTEASCLDVMACPRRRARLAARRPDLPWRAHHPAGISRGRKSGRERYVDTSAMRCCPPSPDSARFCDVFCERTAFSVQETRRILEKARSLGYRLKLHANQLGETGGATLAAELGAISADHLDFAWRP